MAAGEDNYEFRLPRLTIRQESVPDVLVLFGDESRTDTRVTYGIVATNGERHQAHAEAAWNRVIAAAGGLANARVHARELFSGEARAKSAWRHLNESNAARLTVDLMTAIAASGVRFFLGVVYKDTYPDVGVPAGFNAAGEQTYAPFTDEFGYAFAFAAAVHAMAEILEEHIREYLTPADGDTDHVQADAAEELIEVIHTYLT